MQAQPAQDVTAILRAWTGGDERALDRLLPVLHEELRRTARAYMRRERSGHTLQTSALVNEVFLRLVDFHQVHLNDRAHFLTLAAHGAAESAQQRWMRRPPFGAAQGLTW
jgi:RNA polymerase sigma-70 factor (ECF subfamily)